MPCSATVEYAGIRAEALAREHVQTYLLRRKGLAVELSNKLDLLQEMVQAHANDPNVSLLLGLLAEHADEDEMTTEFLLCLKGHLGFS